MTSSVESDGSWDLVTRVQAGDREAFSDLYKIHNNQVSRFVSNRLRDRGAVEDITSETFVRALRRIDSVTNQGTDFGAWLTVIARNLVLDHVKSSRCQRETVTAEIGDADTEQDSPEQVVIRRDAAADVRRRVSQLPTDQQECIRLRYFQDLSVAETAAEMGRNEGAVKALAHRSVVGLRASMAKDARTVAPTRTAVPDPLDRARHAVAEVQQHRPDQAQQQVRAQQLARWHTDDQAAAVQSHQHDLTARADVLDPAGGERR
jgi:RNA polymerase sigma-70 factor (ECF subfamily)